MLSRSAVCLPLSALQLWSLMLASGARNECCVAQGIKKSLLNLNLVSITASMPMSNHRKILPGELRGDSAPASLATMLGRGMFLAGHTLSMGGFPALGAADATYRCTPYMISASPRYA